MDKYGNTPLHIAAKYGHELLISTLMTNGADTARYASPWGGCPFRPLGGNVLLSNLFVVSRNGRSALSVRCVYFDLFLSFQTWDPWNVPLALSCAVRVFRLLSQVTLLRFGLI